MQAIFELEPKKNYRCLISERKQDHRLWHCSCPEMSGAARRDAPRGCVKGFVKHYTSKASLLLNSRASLHSVTWLFAQLVMPEYDSVPIHEGRQGQAVASW
jgi:hypothetical protein